MSQQSALDQRVTSGRTASTSASSTQNASSWTPSTPPAAEWQSQWHSVLPELEELARHVPLPHICSHLVCSHRCHNTRRLLYGCRKRHKLADTVIMRASQLDAARLDTELTAMLKEQFMKIFSFFQPRLISALQPELTLILELLVRCILCKLLCILLMSTCMCICTLQLQD